VWEREEPDDCFETRTPENARTGDTSRNSKKAEGTAESVQNFVAESQITTSISGAEK